MIHAEFIGGCKPGFILINTSRGKNVNLVDVCKALQSGQIGGACFDVFPTEPPGLSQGELLRAFEMICGMDNVVLSPHVAGWTVESKRKIAEVLLKKLVAFRG